MQVVGLVPFASTFAAFLTRAFDFIRMAAISRANIRLCGSHAGVSIGEDGPSQMALEDLAMMRAVHGSTVLYPCDANQTARLVGLMAERGGISYLRTTREKTPILYTRPTRRVPHRRQPRRARRPAGRRGRRRSPPASRSTRRSRPPTSVKGSDRGPGDRRLLGQADRHRRPGRRGARRPAAASASSRTTGPRAGSATRSSRRSPRRRRGARTSCASCTSPCATCPRSAKPAELLDDAGISARHIVDAVRKLARHATRGG